MDEGGAEFGHDGGTPGHDRPPLGKSIIPKSATHVPALPVTHVPAPCTSETLGPAAKKQQAPKGRHKRIACAAPSGLRFIRIVYPGLSPWAIIRRTVGARTRSERNFKSLAGVGTRVGAVSRRARVAGQPVGAQAAEEVPDRLGPARVVAHVAEAAADAALADRPAGAWASAGVPGAAGVVPARGAAGVAGTGV